MIKKRLLWFPLENLDKRYTKLTREWYRTEFEKNFELVIIEGDELTQTIETGSFLDSCGTIYYKMSQFQKFAQMVRNNEVKDGDILFFDDLWAPGLHSVKYVTQMGKSINVKIFGVIHAGSHTPSDDVAVKLDKSWTRYFEQSIYELCDGVFVGSNFHKQVILNYIGVQYSGKIHNTGLPFNVSSVFRGSDTRNWVDKDNIVVFPHRRHPEKHHELFDRLEQDVKKEVDFEVQFVRTMDLDLTNEDYYKLVGKSKVFVSFADQENFGYATLEAATFGNALVLPNRLVYPEFYPKSCLFDTYEQCKQMVMKSLSLKRPPGNTINLSQIFKFEHSIKNMLNIIKDRKSVV